MFRMRTIKDEYKHIKVQDLGTAITLHLIRKLVLQGKIPYIKAGNRFLLDIDSLFTYLSGVLADEKPVQEEQFELPVIPDSGKNKLSRQI